MVPSSELAIIDHALGLPFAAGQGFRFDQADLAGHTEHIFDFATNIVGQCLQHLDLVGEGLLIDLYLNLKRIEVCFTVDDQLVVRLDAFNTEKNRLNLGRENIDAANNHHVIATPAHPLETTMGPTADAGFSDDPGNIPGSVADQRDTFLGDRGNDQFALFAVRQHLTGFRIDNFRDEMILPDMQTGLGLAALDADAGTEDLREPVHVDRLEVECGLNLATHLLTPGLGTKDPDFEFQ